MYAEVIPIVKLPRRFTFFDYRIPPNIDVKIGDLVRIKLKNRDIFGVVKKTKNHTDIHAHDIVDVAISGFLTNNDIKRYEKIAKNIYQSPSNLMVATFGKMKMRFGDIKMIQSSGGKSIGKDVAKQLKSVINSNENYIFAQMSLEGEFALSALIRKRFKNQILILLPREHIAQDLIDFINLGSTTQILHGKTPDAKREKILHGWRTGKIKTLIGIRNVSLLPAKKLDAIHIIDCTADDWSILDKNPRFDARPSVELLANQHKAKIFTSGSIPILGWPGKKIYANSSSIKIINLKAEEERTGEIFITDSLKKAIASTLQNRKKVLISFNRKGIAKALECSNCGHIPLCGVCGAQPIVRLDDLICPACKSEMWIPEKCPACGLKKMTQRGIGNKKIKSILQRLFPNATIGIIDKGICETGDIIIATEYYFSQIHKAFDSVKFGLIAELSFDRNFGSKYTSSMQVAYKLHRMKLMSQSSKSECIIQTFNIANVKEMLSIEKFIKKEIENRKNYSLPPFKPFVSVHCKDEKEPQQELNDLNKLPDSCIIEVQTSHYDF